jgi:hypothetical protein
LDVKLSVMPASRCWQLLQAFLMVVCCNKGHMRIAACQRVCDCHWCRSLLHRCQSWRQHQTILNMPVGAHCAIHVVS